MDEMQAHKQTDLKLAQMERKISAIYSRADKELQEKIQKYLERFEAQDKKKRALLEKGKITEEQYKQWRLSKIIGSEKFKAFERQIAEEIKHVNETALAYINGRLPDIYALNYNALAPTVESAVKGYSFNLVNAETVKKLATIDKTLLPYKKLDGRKDVRWNAEKVNAEVLQGILQGEDVRTIGKRLGRVTEMNKVSQIRNARTSVTSAENAGRNDSYKSAKDDGIILDVIWLATLDSRTRHSHALLHRKKRSENGYFDNGLRYPGDVDGDPSEVYNCRCTTIAKVKGFKKVQAEKVMSEKRKEKTKNIETLDDISQQTAETLQNAYNKHNELNNLRRTTSNEEIGLIGKGDFSAVGADYSKLSLKSAKAFQDTFDDLINEYDTPFARVKIMNKQDALFRKNSFAYTYHNYETDVAEIIINPIKCSDYQKYTEKIRELSNKGWCVKIPNQYAEKYVATHEFAHTLANLDQPLVKSRNWVNADYKKIQSFREEVNKVYHMYIKDIGFLDSIRKRLEAKVYFEGVYTPKDMDDLKEYSALLRSKKISNYSMSNADEFMAEAFTHAKLADSKNEYADSILKIIDKYFKRR